MLQVKCLHYSCGRDQYKYKHRVISKTELALVELALMQFMNNILEVTSTGYRRRLFQICSFAKHI